MNISWKREHLPYDRVAHVLLHTHTKVTLAKRSTCLRLSQTLEFPQRAADYR